MARTSHPWFWEERQGWYVNKDGQRHFLGEHPAGAPPPGKRKGKWNAPPTILQAFHALMARPADAPRSPAALAKSGSLSFATSNTLEARQKRPPSAPEKTFKAKGSTAVSTWKMPTRAWWWEISCSPL